MFVLAFAGRAARKPGTCAGAGPCPARPPGAAHIEEREASLVPGVAAGGEVRGAPAALTRLLPLPLLCERDVAAPAATPVAAQLVVGLGDRSAVDSSATAGTAALSGGTYSAAVVAVVSGGEPLNAPVPEPWPRLRVLPSPGFRSCSDPHYHVPACFTWSQHVRLVIRASR